MTLRVLAVSASDVLAVIALIVAVTVLVSAVAGVVLARRLKRPLLLAPGARGVSVPLRWRWSLSPAAVLHRRLVLATNSVLSTGPIESTRWGGVRQQAPWQELLQDLLDLAVSVDRRLVSAERQPRGLRRRLYAEIEPQVAKVEQVAERMRATVSARELSGGDRSADDVVARLDAIDAALGEIQGLDPDKALQRGAGPAGPGGRPENAAGPGGRPENAVGPGSTPAPGSGAGTSTGTSWTEKVPWPGQRRPDRPG
ncbi:MAG TPA: hypothetical protein VGL32_01150 [Acidimicrobiales bacterium]